MWRPDLKELVKRLEDRFFDYVLVINCPKCGHERRADPVALAQIVGASAIIADVMKRMRCTKCQAKGAEYQLDRKPRPRGHNTH